MLQKPRLYPEPALTAGELNNGILCIYYYMKLIINYSFMKKLGCQMINNKKYLFWALSKFRSVILKPSLRGLVMSPSWLQSFVEERGIRKPYLR